MSWRTRTESWRRGTGASRQCWGGKPSPRALSWSRALTASPTPAQGSCLLRVWISRRQTMNARVGFRKIFRDSTKSCLISRWASDPEVRAAAAGAWGRGWEADWPPGCDGGPRGATAGPGQGWGGGQEVSRGQGKLLWGRADQEESRRGGRGQDEEGAAPDRGLRGGPLGAAARPGDGLLHHALTSDSDMMRTRRFLAWIDG